jgi:hypothetical protein
VWHGLVDNDQWQAGYLTGDQLKELKFWFGGNPVSTSAVSGTAGAATLVPDVSAPPATAARHPIRGASSSTVAPPKATGKRRKASVAAKLPPKKSRATPAKTKKSVTAKKKK